MGTETDIVARFDIHLDAGDEPTFKGGELITGKLLIELRKPIIINAVKLQMKGRAAWLNDPLKKDDIEKVCGFFISGENDSIDSISKFRSYKPMFNGVEKPKFILILLKKI